MKAEIIPVRLPNLPLANYAPIKPGKARNSISPAWVTESGIAQQHLKKPLRSMRLCGEI